MLATTFLLGVGLGFGGGPPTGPSGQGPDLPAFFSSFERALGEERGDPGRFRDLAHEWLWKTYEWPGSARERLYEFVREGPDGPGRGLAALAVIAYHEPEGAALLLEVAKSEALHPATRYWCLNAAPCVLSMGDVWFTKDASDPKAVEEFVEGLRPAVERAKSLGIGRGHSVAIRDAFDLFRKTPEAEQGDIPLALWHVSAYLGGHLDLSDRDRLLDLLDPERAGPWRGNLVGALSFASNRDFREQAKARTKAPEVSEEYGRTILAAAREWWTACDVEKASRDWKGVVIEGFSGYRLDRNALGAPQSLRELRRALRDESPVRRYNAYRLLNDLADTHFDLDFVFGLDGFALHPVVGNMKREENEERLRAWWEAWIDKRLEK